MGITGRVSSKHSLGTLDGPGVRYILFLKGCPLRCAYCHNPETWDASGGELRESGELIEEFLKYKGYYAKRGGVTFSGGEPLLQGEFLRALLKGCKENALHTAVDTSGAIIDGFTEDILALCDLLLLDIKMTTEEDYKKYTGGSLKRTLEFLRLIERHNRPVIIRHVVVPGINDNEEDIGRLCELIEGFSCIKKLELLPFRKLCINKYEKLGIEFPFKEFNEATSEDIKRLYGCGAVRKGEA